MDPNFVPGITIHAVMRPGRECCSPQWTPVMAVAATIFGLQTDSNPDSHVTTTDIGNRAVHAP